MTSFQKEIKQENFASKKEKAFLNIVFTAHWLRDNINPIFKEYGILKQHYNILRIVRGKNGEPSSPSQILEVMLDKGRDLTRLVDKLVKIGYLERKQSELNRRKIEIYMTSKGLQVTNVLEDRLKEWYNKNVEISEADASLLSDLLDKIRG